MCKNNNQPPEDLSYAIKMRANRNYATPRINDAQKWGGWGAVNILAPKILLGAGKQVLQLRSFEPAYSAAQLTPPWFPREIT